MSIIPLSDDQKRQLVDLAESAPDLLIHRARLILAYAAGKPTMQAASDAGISRGRARYWKRQFLARGMDIFTSELADAGTPIKSYATTTSPEARSSSDSSVGIGPGTAFEQKLDVPYPQVHEKIGILPEDTLGEAGRKVWLFHFALMLFHEEGTLRGQDVEELHDMRVATRRMRTAFDVFGPAFDPKIMKHYLKGLRNIGRALGAVRDMDVILEHAHAYQQKNDEQSSGLQPLLNSWQQIITKKRARMTRRLQSQDYLDFKYNFNLFLQAPEQLKIPVESAVMNSHLRDIVPALVYGRYAAVRAYESLLLSASVAQLHALRIEFKKFRYVLEYFREILGENIVQAISELKHLQDHLGELHDVDVACHLVSDFLAGWEEDQLSLPITERKNPQPIVTYLAFLHAERYRLISSSPALWLHFSRPQFRQNLAQAISSL